MTKIVCIGSATKDVFFPTNEGVLWETPEDATSQRKLAFELGAKYHIGKRQEALGGCAANVACGLAKMGEHVECHAAVGEDEIGGWIKKELAEKHVGVADIQTVEKNVSDLSLIIEAENLGDRVIFSSHGASQFFRVEKKALSKADWLYVCDLSGAWQDNLDSVFAQAKKERLKIAFNPRQQMLHENAKGVAACLSDCEILFLNKDEAIEIVKAAVGTEYREREINDEIFLLKKIKGFGVEVVVLTDGERGAWTSDGKRFLHAEALLQTAKDTTGAGDAFASGFLGAHLRGGDLVQSLKWGVVNSSSSVKYYGGSAGLLTMEQIIPEAESVVVKEVG